MSIPFIRQFPPTEQHPKGERRLATFDCSTLELEHMGQRFIAMEGAYVCEILPDGRARVAACQFIKGAQVDVAEEICENGPDLPKAVERMIEASMEALKVDKVVPIKRTAPKPRIITDLN